MNRIINITSILGLLCVIYFSYKISRKEIIIRQQKERARNSLKVGMDIDAAKKLLDPYFEFFETEFEGAIEIEKCGDSIRTYLVYPSSVLTNGFKLELNLCEHKIISIK